MISLSIDRSSLGLLPLTIADGGRTVGSIVLTARGWDLGARQSDNAYAESRWVDGAQLVSTKRSIMSANLQCRIWGSSLANAYTLADELGAALEQYAFTITETQDGALTAVTHTCMPATWSYANDPDDLRLSTLIFAASIPRQP